MGLRAAGSRLSTGPQGPAMRDIDDTDRELIRLLLADARRPYSELAEEVGLSPPAVSDRVDRLRELGVIERFTLDLDRSRLQAGTRLLVTLEVEPGGTGTVREELAGLEGVAATVGDETYEFCCESCEARFRERYEEMTQGA